MGVDKARIGTIDNITDDPVFERNMRKRDDEEFLETIKDFLAGK